MTTPVVFLPIDLTGSAEENFVSGEHHEVAVGSKAIIRPNFGDFFAAGFQLLGVSGQNSVTALQHGTDYFFGQLNEKATLAAAGSVYQVVLIKDTKFFTTFSISYHALGGEVSGINWPRLYQSYLQVAAGTPTPYDNLTDVPRFFNPQAHTHDAADLYGLEYILSFLAEIKDSVTKTRSVDAKNEQIRYQLNLFKQSQNALNTALPTAIRKHIDNSDFAHVYTKQMVGLGNLANYAFTAVTINGVQQPAFASPATLKHWTDNPPEADVPEHVLLTDNPHEVTKEQIGLGLVENYPLQLTYSPGVTNFLSLFDPVTPTVYVGPGPFAMGIADYGHYTYNTATQPLVDAATTDAQSKLSTASDILASTATVQTQVDSLLTSFEAASNTVTQTATQAKQVSDSLNIVHGNDIYSQTLIQLLQYERTAFELKQGVTPDGYYPVPKYLSGLELWLSARNPQNVLLDDITGKLRVINLVDMSPRARVFSSPADLAPVLKVSADIEEGSPGIVQGKVLSFLPGQSLDQISGPPIRLTVGMTIIALVRTGPVGGHLTLLSAPNAQQDTGVYAYTPTAQSLAIRSGGDWKPLEAPAGSMQPNTSSIVVGVVSAASEAFCWLSSSTPIDYFHFPRGVNTPESDWPGSNYVGTPLTRIGNANFDSDNTGEIAELLLFRRQLSYPEVNAVAEYLKLCYTEGTALSLDYSALNAF